MSEIDGKPRVFFPRCRAILSVVLDNYADDDLGGTDKPLVIAVLPKSATIHRNKRNQADSWQMVFSATDLPFDPELIRAGQAEIFMFDAGSMDDSTMVTSRQDPRRPGTDSTTAIAAATGQMRALDNFTQDTPPIIVGLFDDHSLEMSDNGKWVTLQGQDYTQLLLKHWPPVKGTHRARRIPVGKPLLLWARELMHEVDPSGRIGVRFDGANPLTIATHASGVDNGPIVGATGLVGKKRGIPIQQETTYFDVFYKVCLRMGYVCDVQGMDLVISQPKNLSNLKDTVIRTMAWGNNIEHLSMSRKLGKEKVPRVVVKSWDDDKHEMIVVEVPPGGAHAKEIAEAKNPSKKTHVTETHKAPKAASASAKRFPAKKPTAKVATLKEEDEFVVMPVHGVTDRDALRRAGETYRTLIGRGERKIVFKTHDLVDVDGKPIIDIRAGDAFYVVWQDFNAEAFSNPSKTQQERVDWLVARGYQDDVAALLAQSYERMMHKAQRPLRAREVTIGWDNDGGLDIEVELQDFVTVGGVRGANETDTQTVDHVLAGVGFGKSAGFQ